MIFYLIITLVIGFTIGVVFCQLLDAIALRKSDDELTQMIKEHEKEFDLMTLKVTPSGEEEVMTVTRFWEEMNNREWGNN